MSNDSIGKTLTVAFLLCVVCSIVVSTAAVGLKPLQDANKELDKKQNILAAASLLKEGVSVDEAFESIEIKYVDLDSGAYVDGPANFNQKKAAKEPSTSIALDGQQDIAQIKRRSNIAEIYLAKNEQGVVDTIILPVHGYGLWSTLYGFLALQADANTVVGLGFYQHAETPGLGGEVDNPKWKSQWPGKRVFDEQGAPATTMFKGVVTKETPGGEHKFDALSGATITGRGVENLVNFWVGDLGFGPYLKRIQAEGV